MQIVGDVLTLLFIVRAHQKDAYFESYFYAQITEALNVIKGQRFINLHSEEILVATKALYLALTTLIGARTLGEEYVDLIYVNRTGKKLPKLFSRLGFVVSYAFVPYVLVRVVRYYRVKYEDEDCRRPKNWFTELISSYPKLLDTLMNLHIALFYFEGKYYSLSRRIFGLRYAFGHNKDPEKLKNVRGDYSFLGYVIFFQFFVRGLVKAKSFRAPEKEKEKKKNDINKTEFSSVADLELYKEKIDSEKSSDKNIRIDLSDPEQLLYIPDHSRSCMLCLSLMVEPAAAVCGHIFCWDCIVNWIREHPECPLCRQGCLEQNLLPLR